MLTQLKTHHRGLVGDEALAIQESRLIELKGVTKAYDVTAGKFLALRGIDMQVDAGEFVAVVGKSGSRKSTLINMITGIDNPTSGEVFVTSTPIHWEQNDCKAISDAYHHAPRVEPEDPSQSQVNQIITR